MGCPALTVLRVPVASSLLRFVWGRCLPVRWHDDRVDRHQRRTREPRGPDGAKIDRGLMQRLLRGGCPQLERVAVTATAMAIVTAQPHIHRERAVTTSARDSCNGQRPLPLRPRALLAARTRASPSTCSIVISLRTHSKSTPGMEVPHSETACEDRSVPLHHSLGNGNGPLTHTHHGKRWVRTQGPLQTLTFFLGTGRSPLG